MKITLSKSSLNSIASHTKKPKSKQKTMQDKSVQPLHKKWTWRKPKGKPKRPLSAYNIFFADVRQNLINARKTKNGIGFQNLAQAVATKWKDLDPALKVPYIEKAKIAMERYKVEVSQWEATQKTLKASMLITEVKAATFNNTMTSPITPINSRNCNDVTSNEMPSFLQASQFSPLPNTTKVETRSSPRHVHYPYSPHTWTNDSTFTQTMMDDASTTMRYRVGPSQQSTVYHSGGTTTACVTPMLHYKHLYSSNDPPSNFFYDEAYEPLPLSNTLGQCYGRSALSTEHSEVFNYPSYELFPSTDIYRQTIAESNTGGSSNTPIEICYNALQDPTLNQSINEDPNNSNWDAVQVEKLLRSLENDEWNRFM